MRNWTRRTISSLFLCRKLRSFLGKSKTTAATGALLFDSNMHKIVCRLGISLPKPHWGSLQRSPDHLTVFRGPAAKGRGGERKRRGRREKEAERRGREKGEGKRRREEERRWEEENRKVGAYWARSLTLMAHFAASSINRGPPTPGAPSPKSETTPRRKMAKS